MYNKDRKRILYLLLGLIALSLSLVIYLTYFVIAEAEPMKNHAANRRSFIVESKIKRGSIYDRNGELLASSEGQEGNYQRIYNYPILYSHIIGYSHPSLGKSGLESSYNDYLLNRNGNRTLKQISDMIRERHQDGNSLILTIDTKVQSKARELLESNTEKGSIVLMNPKTGEIYAMVSLPDFNAQKIQQDWDSIQENKDGILLNRSINGRYPPGSTFKMVTAAALLQDGNIDLSYEDLGTQVIDGREFRNATAGENGEVGLREALANSLNTYFVSKGVELGQDKLGAMADKFMFNQEIPFDLKITPSIFDHRKKLETTNLAASAIGQGDVLATPLNMAMVASAIGNKGTMEAPILVKEVEDSNGSTIIRKDPKVLSEVISPEIAEQLTEYMVSVVNNGIGSNAALSRMQVAGKTGTAENSSGKNHAWFIGFAPAEDPEFAVAVILEQADKSGGTAAAPVARDLLLYAARNIEISNEESDEQE
ncbi:penicillin-binding protein 2 [Peptoniphilus sp. KCTC 25270]|uniref:peptidoglycan D,D-transpeptidase FtsI family protein n=1 Tax=Peptoniphilus sp. KCTC 25270 TaxID=2897414 RepID=UPI001E4A59B1|nr:penicillin-binding transpeptidase domain-containing protein [Peptoniphilus sp. KCTC 25270]MCD1147025.1 penicillin-binding protein 2 [Peptoniphilus sp. KCTC 25270]